MAEFIEEMRAEDLRQSFIAASFNAFQQGAGGKKSWGQYLSELGLAEKGPTLTDKARKELASKAYKIAERALRIDRNSKRGLDLNAKNIPASRRNNFKRLRRRR